MRWRNCKFKKGDKVRLVDDRNCRELKKGEIYTVRTAGMSFGDAIDLAEIELTNAYHDYRFELVEEYEKT